MVTYYQKDFQLAPGIFSESGNKVKATLFVNPTGNLQFVYGDQKLSEQILRAIVNDDTVSSNILNASDIRSIRSLIILTLRRFRQTQINETNRSDPDIIGFNIYRYSGLEGERKFTKISNDVITHTFTDTQLTNGIEYTYGITRVYEPTVESEIIEKIEVTPTQFLSQQEYIIGQYFSVKPGYRSVTFYVDYSRTFKASELLETVDQVDVVQSDTDPRKFYVNIRATTLEGSKISLATDSFKLT